MVRFKPLAVLQLTASHAWVGYFGTFGLVQSFDDSRIDYSDTQLDINEENDENFATTGSTTKLEGILQAKAGPVAVRSTFLGTRYSLDTRGKPIWFDTGLEDVPRAASRMGDQERSRRALGHQHRVWRPVDAGPGPSRSSASSAKTHRPPTGWARWSSYRWGVQAPGSRFHAPTVILLAQWYTRHAYRTGEDVSQGLPYLAAAFIFSGDLIPW